VRRGYVLAATVYLALGSTAVDAACVSPPRYPVQARLGWPGMERDMPAISTVTDLSRAQLLTFGGYGSSAPSAQANVALSEAQQDLLKQEAEAAKCR